MPVPPTPFEESPNFVQSLARGLEVIRTFDGEHPALTLTEVAERTGLAKAAARRSLMTLQHLGFVGVRGRQFYLTPRILDLGFGYLTSLQLPELALPWMEHLSQQVDESSSLSVLDGEEIVYVARVPMRRVMTISLGVGARLPAFASSMGRVLLAGLPQAQLDAWLAQAQTRALTPRTIFLKADLKHEIERVRRQGYAIVHQELELGLCSIALPIRNRQGKVLAAVNVGMQSREGIEKRILKEVLPRLRRAQASIESAIPVLWTANGR